MSKKEVIDPVTRVEGHGKITIHLDDEGSVEDAQFHVTEFRGFEEFVEGRPIWEMPEITARICGICPVSHQLAAAKAADDVMDADVPESAHKLRELLHMGQVLQSHALSFFYLSSPDLVLGYDADPAERNIEGVLNENPQLAERGIDLRSFGQNVIAALGEKKVHPDFAVAGGVSNTLDREDGEELLEESQPLPEYLRETIDLLKGIFEDMDDDTLDYATYPTGYMGLVTEEGGLEHYDGDIRLVDEGGDQLEEIDDGAYRDIIAERSKEWSYLKFPYYKERGFEDGQYRVGPLARLNAVDDIATPQAREEWVEFMDAAEGAVHERSTYYHWARLIEMLYCVERIQELLEDDDVYEGATNVPTKPKAGTGVGVIEAPRGTLIHEFTIDDGGIVEDANFIVATTHNNGAMNRGVLSAAEKFVEGPEIPEDILNKMESVIRCYDPCLSCSTHAIGEMPLELELEQGGETVASTSR
ncbi:MULTISPECIES: Ni/Fe hydrogenase subunit alpha [unclassified Halorhabdus]|uniref:Ni/Fe hydrogenase subunit alpha n=1 Tax=unclassified Halorhabdus TaxID=2621901 RepID=UPI0023DA24B7|nr:MULTISPECIES: Ni/Fe hydrogenase subunit alpha [unclassified Halorhabdus]WEL18838.1 Coenzyme F420-reducing hydrogenase, alpha subunit [Halorhabdus sp. SVX81]WEL22487.1 Coenzyme F420-reducing hydrogenase, alpha subunit [Halorhabdus sp. BNX81]